MKKMLIPVILTALLCLMTSCASKTEAEMSPNTMPSANPTGMLDEGLMPDADATPGTTGGMPADPNAALDGRTVNTMTGITTAAKARTTVKAIKEELERLSEVDEAKVMVAGTTAVIALDFDTQYQAGIDDRMEKMVKERVKSVVGSIENVIVTDDTAVGETLGTLIDRLDGEADMTGMEAELQKLITRIRNMA